MLTRSLWVPILAALETFEDGAERPFAGGLVLFQGPRLPGEPGDAARQPQPALGREYAPAEETIRAPELRVFTSALQQLLQRRVQRFRFFQSKLYRRTTG
jgi:hypothetical protein